MTRGKMILLGADQKIYTTVEFDGDIYSEGHGDEIIQAYEDGHLQAVDSFYNFVARFDRRNFRYAEYAGEMISWIFGEESKKIDVRENWTDYLYIVNESGEKYTFLTSEGQRSLNTSQLAIIYFQQLKMIKDGKMAIELDGEGIKKKNG